MTVPGCDMTRRGPYCVVRHLRPVWRRLTVALLSVLMAMALTGPAAAAERELRVAGASGRRVIPPPVRHIVLFIASGMQLANQIAASRYLHGRDDGLWFQRFAYQGVVATWDRSTYDAHARARGLPAYDPQAIWPFLGYDPVLGGVEPYPLQTHGTDEAYLIGDGEQPAAATSAEAAAWALATGMKGDGTDIGRPSAWSPLPPAQPLVQRLQMEKQMALGIVSTESLRRSSAALVGLAARLQPGAAAAGARAGLPPPEVVIVAADGPGMPASRAAVEVMQLFHLSEGSAVIAGRRQGERGADSLAQAARQALDRGRHLVGVFGAGGRFGGAAALPSPRQPEIRLDSDEDPRLADATTAALHLLRRQPFGFIAVIEQGGIAAANAAGDLPRAIGAVAELNSAVAAAIDAINLPDDDVTWENTLLVVAADRAVGQLRLAGPAALGRGELPPPPEDGEGGPYRTRAPTNALVPLSAAGAAASLFRSVEGQWYPCTRIIDNVQLYQVLAEAAGVPVPPPLAALADGPGRCSTAWRRR